MYFANPWGLLGLLSLPVIAAIHLFQRRFPVLLVAGGHLWGAQTRIQTAGRRRDRLPITATLLLELLAGLLFSLALAQPRFGELGSVAHLVVVLDDSASMSGAPVEEPTFREMAIANLGERMDELDRNARVTLIRSGLQPTRLGEQAMTWDEARGILADWRPRSPQHAFSSSWDEAARIVGPEGQFLFVTDHLDAESELLPLGMDVVSVGRKLINVTLQAARWTFDSQTGEGRLYVRISNYGNAPTTALLTAMAAEQTILQQSVPLGAQTEAPLDIAVPGGLRRLTLTLTAPGDGLSVDNTVTLIEPKVRLLTVAVTLPENSPEQLLTQRVLTAMPNVQLGSADDCQLLIAPAGILPPQRSDLWWFGIGPINQSPVVRKQAKNLLGPYLIEKQHPLMDGIVLGGVVWGGVQPTNQAMRPLISAGRIPLLGQLVQLPMTAYLMNIDLARSNLGESPDWPILMTNLIERRRDDLPGLRRWNYQVGETIVFRAPPSATAVSSPGDAIDFDDDSRTLLLVHESGDERRLVRDRNDFVEITRLNETGVYNVMDGDKSLGEFAVNFFDANESRSLADLAPGQRKAQAEATALRLSVDDPYSWLMVLAILLLLATILSDWLVLRPRTLKSPSRSA